MQHASTHTIFALQYGLVHLGGLSFCISHVRTFLIDLNLETEPPHNPYRKRYSTYEGFSYLDWANTKLTVSITLPIKLPRLAHLRKFMLWYVVFEVDMGFLSSFTRWPQTTLKTLGSLSIRLNTCRRYPEDSHVNKKR